MNDLKTMFTLYQLYHLGFDTVIKNGKRNKIVLDEHHVNRAYIQSVTPIKVSLRKDMLMELVGHKTSQYSWRLIKGEKQ